MKRLKWSYYVNIYENSHYSILHNLISNAVLAVKPNQMSNIQAYIDEGTIISDDEKNIIAELYLKGILIDYDITEEMQMQKTYQQVRYGNSELASIYFMPTLNCNLRCKYCVIGNMTSGVCTDIMSDDCIEKTVELLCNNKYLDNIRHFNIILFGGEPSLVAKENIKFINLMNSTKKENIKVSYQLITNGYKWKEQDIDTLIENGVTSFQVTLDGPEEIHNKRRYAIDKKGTFHEIIKNIKLINSKNAMVFIRINIDEENYNSIGKLLEFLNNEGLKEHVGIQFAPVDPSDYADYNGYDEAVLNTYGVLYKKAFEMGFNVTKWIRACSIRQAGNLAIAPNGDIYKCPNCVGDKIKCVGNVFDGFNKIYQDYLNEEIRDRCQQCKYLPICMGGCDIMRENKQVGKDFCFHAANDILIDYIKEKYNFELKNLKEKRIKNLITGTQK